jgi:type II secretory pathway pseudopilin PulG
MKKIKNNKAFTLIEVLLYTAIFAIVGGLTTGVLLTVTQVQQRESASAEVTGQLNFIMQRLRQIVSESSNIEIEAGVTTSTLKLRMKDSAKDPTCLSLVNGVIKLAEGQGTNPNECATTTSDLTSDRVIVDALNFKKFTQYPGHDTLSLDIQMTYNSQNPKSRVQRTLQSAIARVSAATFDSNLLPGATSFTVGQSGSAWQTVFVGDGSITSPSYSFGADTNVGIFRPGADILGFTTNSAERMRIGASGNVGIGTTAPASLFELYSSTADTKLTITAAASTDPQIVFRTGATPAIQSLIGIDYSDANKLKLVRGSNIATSTGITIDSSGNVGIGTTNPEAKLQVAGNTLFLADKKVNANISTYYVTKKRYHVEATKAVVTNTVSLDMAIVNALCKDEDGCSVTLGMRDWDSAAQPGNVASRGPYRFYISQSSNWWRLSNTDSAGNDGDGVVQHILYVWDCYFTDGTYTSGSGSDPSVQLGLLNWNANYTDPNMVCVLDIDD